MLKNKKEQNNRHIPVMASEVVEYLQPKEGEAYLDVTAGYGGHAKLVLDLTKSPKEAVLVDRDDAAVSALQKKFADQGVQIVHDDFLSASSRLNKADRKFDMILADLGLSSPHLEESDRGFSIKRSGPLDMRYDRRQKLTAAEIVNEWDQKELKKVIDQYGQEPKARSIAEHIVKNRPVSSTDQLAAIVSKAWPRWSRMNPATRTFQALRIAVNNELELIEKSLPLWAELLKPGGRLAVISFHSLEDRLVKKFFAEQAGDRYDSSLILLTKKPVTPRQIETVSNPRARSAKLRVCRKK